MNLFFKLFDKSDFLSICGKLKKDEKFEKGRKFSKKTKILEKEENSGKRRKFWVKMKILEKDENSEKRRNVADITSRSGLTKILEKDEHCEKRRKL